MYNDRPGKSKPELFVYADTSDAGSDQSARRRMLRSALANVGHILYVDVNCLLHQFHLIVKDSLVMMDSFLQSLKESGVAEDGCRGGFGFGKYFASTAKLANYWRERVSEFIEKYEQIHRGDTSGVPYKQYPLRVVGGRWGSIDLAERFYLARGKKRLQPVLLAMLSSSMKADTQPKAKAKTTAKAKAKAAAGHAQEDGVAAAADLQDDLDERLGFRIRLTKWATGALQAVQSDLYWLMLRLAHTSRAPLRHFYLWCQKHTENKLLLKLVTKKADEVISEYEALISSFGEWFQNALGEADAQLSPEILDVTRDLVYRLVLAGAGGFQLRVRSMCYKQLSCHQNLIVIVLRNILLAFCPWPLALLPLAV